MPPPSEESEARNPAAGRDASEAATPRTPRGISFTSARGDDFGRLLQLLRQEHERLRRENADLRARATHGQSQSRGDGQDSRRASDGDTVGQDEPATDASERPAGASSIRVELPWHSEGSNELTGRSRPPPLTHPPSGGREPQTADPSPSAEASSSKQHVSFRAESNVEEEDANDEKEKALDNIPTNSTPFRGSSMGSVRGATRQIFGFVHHDEAIKERFGGHDTGSSLANRKLVQHFMEKHMQSRHGSGKYFHFRGAKELKAKLKWVRNNKFDYAMAWIILANALFMGVQTSMVLSSTREDKANGGSGNVDQSLWILGDIVFASAFLFELVVRVFAYQVKFFAGSQKWWNLFDCVTIISTLAATAFDLSSAPPNFYINFFKVLRLARLVRSLKMSKSRLFHNLKTVCYTVAGSANAFLSAVLLLAVVIYVFGIMFMQGLQSYLVNPDVNPETQERLEFYFGSVPDTTFTLLNCITGGINWKEVSVTLWDVETSYKWFFVVYITFTVLCVLNILNGVFVTVAIESAQTNKELATENAQFKTVALIEQMVQWFIEADKDMSNKVSWEELHDLMQDDSVRNFFRANDIDIASTGHIFLLLDRDGTGELEPEEFVDNLIMLQGNAKAVDLASLRVVCDDIAERIYAIEDALMFLNAQRLCDHSSPASSIPRRSQTKVPGGLRRSGQKGDLKCIDSHDSTGSRVLFGNSPSAAASRGLAM